MKDTTGLYNSFGNVIKEIESGLFFLVLKVLDSERISVLTADREKSVLPNEPTRFVKVKRIPRKYFNGYPYVAVRDGNVYGVAGNAIVHEKILGLFA